MKYVGLEHTSISITFHEEGECAGNVCVVHHKTDHHMRGYRQFYNLRQGIMYRVCSHDVRHPDPDDTKFISGEYDGKHDCDACCIRFATESEYNDGIN